METWPEIGRRGFNQPVTASRFDVDGYRMIQSDAWHQYAWIWYPLVLSLAVRIWEFRLFPGDQLLRSAVMLCWLYLWARIEARHWGLCLTRNREIHRWKCMKTGTTLRLVACKIALLSVLLETPSQLRRGRVWFGGLVFFRWNEWEATYLCNPQIHRKAHSCYSWIASFLISWTLMAVGQSWDCSFQSMLWDAHWLLQTSRRSFFMQSHRLRFQEQFFIKPKEKRMTGE